MVDTFGFIAIVITFTAVVSYLNRRLLKLHPTIGALAAGLIVAIPFYLAARLSPPAADRIRAAIVRLDFKDVLLEFLLGFMLFAGSLHVNLPDLRRRSLPIGVFAVVGVVVSAFVTAALLHGASRLLGLGLGFVPCLLFGALISPTDPIAVLAIMQKVGAPKDLVDDVCGESLFNDGVGVVMFLAVLRYYTGEAVSVPEVLRLFVVEAAGGIVLGYLMGLLGNRVLASVDDSRVHILTTLAIASGGFTLANHLGASGALAMVVAGVVVGNQEGRLSPGSRQVLDNFWEVVDEVGNTALFALVGFQLLILGWAVANVPLSLLAGLLAIPAVLCGRLTSIAAPLLALSPFYPFPNRAVRILTWGGLRGGLPLAMALSLPSQDRVQFCSLLAMTLLTVAFSILVQGLSIRRMIEAAMRPGPGGPRLF